MQGKIKSLLVTGVTAMALLVSSVGVADQALETRVMALQGAGRLVASYNPNIQRGSEGQRLQEEVRGHYRKLRPLMLSIADVELQRTMRELEVFLDQLPRAHEGNGSMLPLLLNPVLQHHAELDRRLGSLSPPLEMNEKNRLLNELPVDIAKFNLLYQVRLFNGLMVFGDAEGSDVLADLDETILRQFAQLEPLISNDHSALKRSERNYRFARERMLDPSKGWIADAAILYLGQASDTLIEIRRKHHDEPL